MKKKFLATSIHLAISIVIALGILFWLNSIWFPSPMLQLGAVQGVALVFLVDLIVGPALTFVVYKQGKKGLKGDLALIAALQISAITYGMFVIGEQRPAYLVLTYDGFEVISYFEFEQHVSEDMQSKVRTLMTETVLYADTIPVFELPENNDLNVRENSRLNFYMNNVKNFYFDSVNYRVLNRLSEAEAVNASDWNRFPDLECIVIRFMSPHGQAQSCIRQENSGALVSVD